MIGLTNFSYVKLITLLFLLPLTGLAQYTISGKVINVANKEPVADASVFLNNAVVGTKSAGDGTFTLRGVRPGQYDMVISVVGYETSHQTVLVNANIRLPTAELTQKTILLKEVKIKPNDDWLRNFAFFKRNFIGTTENAAKCKILNPEVLDLDFDHKTLLFTAKSDDFLEIENDALGYKIKYQLSNFNSDGKTRMLYYDGSAFFEELKGSASQNKQWQKNRLKAYEGSSMHFLRSAISNSIADEGFTVFRLIRDLNPEAKGSSKKPIQTLVNQPLTVDQLVKRTNVQGRFALGFNDCLYIVYRKKKAKNSFPGVKAADNINQEPNTTIITFDEPYAFFDFNGIVINPHSLIFEGVWGKNLIAELLPVDYVPATNK